jgi:5-methylcytosine-specific restriction endonuclease McrA
MTLCHVCGVEFRKESSTSRYCSPECFDEGRRRRANARWAAAHPKPPRFCPHCGHRLAASKRADAVYCSARCEEAGHNATRKAKWKTGEPAEYVSRAYIIERDRARCHLCGKHCREDEITLDDLIPLAAGGTHAAENLSVACLRCNTSKGARARGEQLRLIG